MNQATTYLFNTKNQQPKMEAAHKLTLEEIQALTVFVFDFSDSESEFTLLPGLMPDPMFDNSIDFDEPLLPFDNVTTKQSRL